MAWKAFREIDFGSDTRYGTSDSASMLLPYIALKYDRPATIPDDP